MAMKKDDPLESLKKAYEEQLARKDRIIEDLKRRESIILNAMLREGDRNIEWKERLDRALKKAPKGQR